MATPSFKPPSRQIPVSLGKASLRIRLEAYYSLIDPTTLTNRSEWLAKFDQIYEKVRVKNDKSDGIALCAFILIVALSLYHCVVFSCFIFRFLFVFLYYIVWWDTCRGTKASLQIVQEICNQRTTPACQIGNATRSTRTSRRNQEICQEQ